MPVFRLDDPDLGIDKSGGPSHAARLFTVGWAAAVFVATAGWLYFITQAAWFIVSVFE
jgi:cell division protein FtsN